MHEPITVGLDHLELFWSRNDDQAYYCRTWKWQERGKCGGPLFQGKKNCSILQRVGANARAGLPFDTARWKDYPVRWLKNIDKLIEDTVRKCDCNSLIRSWCGPAESDE